MKQKSAKLKDIMYVCMNYGVISINQSTPTDYCIQVNKSKRKHTIQNCKILHKKTPKLKHTQISCFDSFIVCVYF